MPWILVSDESRIGGAGWETTIGTQPGRYSKPLDGEHGRFKYRQTIKMAKEKQATEKQSKNSRAFEQ